MDKMEFFGLIFMLSVAPMCGTMATIMIAETGGHATWIAALVASTACFIGGWFRIAQMFIDGE
tara:strand:+ start:414 stop:602 length:189 start_codon:yes stop_codon:yes gene_type:complete